MGTLIALVAATPTPTPTLTIDPDQVTPGVAGFIGIAVIAAAVVFLLIDMLRRVRRAGYRIDVREELDAEEAARTEADGDASAAGDAGGVSSESPAKD